jgi:hypothetical protein
MHGPNVSLNGYDPLVKDKNIKKEDKDKGLLFHCISSENRKFCTGISFRLRFSSYDGTRRPNRSRCDETRQLIIGV